MLLGAPLHSQRSLASGALRVRVVGIEAAVRLQPDPASPVISTVTAGTVLDVQSKHDGWYGVFVPQDSQTPRRLGYLPASLVDLLETPASNMTEAARAFVLDAGRSAVGIVTIATGEIRFGTFARLGNERNSDEASQIESIVRQAPVGLLRSPDGSRLIVIDVGPGRFTIGSGFQPRRQTRVVVLDASTLQTVGTVAGVWGVPIAGFSRDGSRLTVAGPGYRDRTPSEAVTVDVRTGTLLGRQNLTTYLPGRKHWLQWYLGTVIAPDGEHLYLLDWGRRSTDRAKHVDGRINVVSTSTLRLVATLSGGGAPRTLQVDCAGDQVFALSDRPPWAGVKDERDAELRVLRGPDLAATVAVAPWPLFVRTSADRARLHVVSEERIVTVDAESLRDPNQTQVRRAGVTFWQWALARTSHFDPERPFNDLFNRGISDLVLAPDGRVAYAIHNGSSQLSILDVEEGRRIATVTTGRKSAKALRFVSAFPGVALPASTVLAIRADGKFVYVLNTQTEDLTIVDTANTRVVGHMPFPNAGIGSIVFGPLWGRRPMTVLPEGNLLGIETAGALSFIDMGTNGDVAQLRFPGTHNTVAMSNDGRRLFVLSKERLAYLDARTGKFQAALPEFENPTEIVFDAPGSGLTCQS
jgi:DNA-binding beta-propeller fold protein YncE